MKDEKITESEWQIMRILWGNSPQSSAQIISQTASINTWSPTTIKTFISRLVDKGVIGFRLENNKRVYFPLVTEKQCVLNEMKSIIHMIYGGKMNYETEHFIFYGNDDQEFIHQLSSTIEIDLETLSHHLDFQFTQKQSIYLHSSQNRLFSALGMTSAPSWVRVASMWNILHVAPKETFTNRISNRLLHHILTESILYQMNPNLPYWLQQGISAYESQWLTFDEIKDSLIKNSEMINHLNLNNLSENFQLFRESNRHELAYSLIDYMVKNHGYHALNDFVNHPNDMKRIFGTDLQTFLKNWRAYIISQYLGDENL
ncbi:MAG: BlaI/MecI/CopY family transcriptional regulator [Firmicutes bacterium]|nr:BlaI/MecI/CopY family transcriptional regulator [Bacillota bacterium]